MEQRESDKGQPFRPLQSEAAQPPHPSPDASAGEPKPPPPSPAAGPPPGPAAVSLSVAAASQPSREPREEEEEEPLIDKDVLFPSDSTTLTRPLFYVVGGICLITIIEGFDNAVIGDAIVSMQQSFGFQDDSAVTQRVVALPQIVACVAAFAGGQLMDWLGRRGTVVVASMAYLQGCLIVCVAWDLWSLMVGRAFAGAGMGLAILVCPVYAAEVAPAAIRGAIISLSEVTLNVGLFVGFLTSNAVAHSNLPRTQDWRVVFAFGGFLALIALILCPYLPESPRWPMTRDKKADAMSPIQAFCSPGEARMAMATLEEEIAVERGRNGHDRSPLRVKDYVQVLCPRREYRSAVLVALGLGILEQLVAADVMVNYSELLLGELGLDRAMILTGTERREREREREG
ncbi:unnamed protein product [Vitrella brassicaformis CCMP3155]|uniref:Major facilitator superfamily (MFS) profile domain-containing protein n=1 Tax=Vitrella brassicaformis (strain CCMP3155) TaxID=1169540 RepID=A0A0G4GYL5_VITBC|nr:unnamed protein product [Vitrella brassicaformis CCMP3155]|eukprot:CEM36247.1 unnamed protein product [Vitrella brassicaformis CCMP3155]